MTVRWMCCAALIALAASGCTVGPDYHVPADVVAKAPAANGPFVNRDHAAFTDLPLPDHWWRLYDDARLDGYVRQALEANTDLRAAEANLQRANAAIREAEAAQTPGTRVQGSIAKTRQGGIDALSPPGWNYSLGFGVSYPLDLAGGIRRTVEAARADAEAVQAIRDQVRVTVAAAVARNYVGVCSANRSISAAQHVVDVQSQTLDDIRRLFREGRNTAFDVTWAQTPVHQSAAAIPPIIAQRQGAI